MGRFSIQCIRSGDGDEALKVERLLDQVEAAGQARLAVTEKIIDGLQEEAAIAHSLGYDIQRNGGYTSAAVYDV